MAKEKSGGPAGWTFSEGADDVIGTKRDPAEPTVEWTVHAKDLEGAYEAAEEQDRVRSLTAQGITEAAKAEAAELRARADELEGKTPKAAKDKETA